ncbi:uncharacterized protein LOC120116884 [Hibiscus syriacus]|uniref:uncharacterized protein LOC120116884 n=1 Tax=Hibiscus syriacus TaxID=106335 RepID=UPI001924CF3F|nr:uncharacterized protein LOC120116884 [Hibiscus syriacus]
MDEKYSSQIVQNSEVRQWSEALQRQEGDSLQADHVSELLEDELLRALIQFWNPGYNCFTFNQEDMVPTIEEYIALLHIEEAQENRIYSKSIKTQPFKIKLAKIAGVREEWVVARTKQKGESEAAVVDLFEQLPKKINPAPVILAETFRSLNACRRLGGGRFSGCAQLLYVWIRSHFWKIEKISYHRFSTSYSPLREFLEQDWPKGVTKDMWIDAFRNIRDKDIVWRAPWQIQSELLYKCGDYNWVMLLGLWGGIGYVPLLVLRQYDGRQFVPVTAGLHSSEFVFHGNNYKKNILQAVRAWKRTFRTRAGAAKVMSTVGSSRTSAQLTKELNEEKHRVKSMKARNDRLLKSLEKGKQKVEELELVKRERIIKYKAENREAMKELKREKDRVKELEDEKNSILEGFEAEKTIMFRGFEAEMNNMLVELDDRG